MKLQAGMEHMLLIGAILVSLAFIVGISIFMVNSYVFNPQAQAIVVAQTTTAAANSLSIVEKGEFVIQLQKSVDIEIHRNDDGIYIFRIEYMGLISKDATESIRAVDRDLLVDESTALGGGSYETPFLCRVNEIKATGVNMIYITKIPQENFVRISNFRSKTTGGDSV